MTVVDPILGDRLRSVGLDPAAFGDPDDAWRRLRERFGPRVTRIDRFDLTDRLRAGVRKAMESPGYAGSPRI